MQDSQALSPPPPPRDFENRNAASQRRRLAGVLVALLIAASALVLPSGPAAAQTEWTAGVFGEYFVQLGGTNAHTLVREGESVTVTASIHRYLVSLGTDGRPTRLDYTTVNNATGAPMVIPLRLDTSIAGSAQAEDVTLSSITIPNGHHSASATVTVVDDDDTEEFERVRIVAGDLPAGVLSSKRKPSSVFMIRHSDGADLGRLQFRVCEASDGVCPVDGDAGWVETDTPSITLTEGGAAVSYQYRLSEVSTPFDSIEVRPTLRHKVVPATTSSGSATTARLPDLSPPGSADWDRLTCEASADHERAGYPALRLADAEFAATLSYCPHRMNAIGWDQRDDWHTVTFSAGEDADTLDHTGAITHFTMSRQVWWLGDWRGNYYQDPQRFPVSLTIIDDDRPDSVGFSLTPPERQEGRSLDDQEDTAKLSVEDADQPEDEAVPHAADPAVIAKVKALAAQTQHGAAHVNRWQRALAGLGAFDPAAVSGGAMTAAEAQQMADRHSSPVWDEVVAELTTLEAAPEQTQPPPTPEVSITSAMGGTEGDPVTFTVTASPAPTADLAVSVTVAVTGDFGFGTAPTSVTIPASGTATVTIPTADDEADEPDGSVTLTLNAGSGYTVGAPSSETATVADDDEPPPPVQDEPDESQDTVLAACGNSEPTLSISSPAASRSDATVDFVVSLSCVPSGSLMMLLTPVRDGDIGENMFVALSAEQTASIVTLTIGSETQLGLALAWSRGLANSQAQGDVAYTD